MKTSILNPFDDAKICCFSQKITIVVESLKYFMRDGSSIDTKILCNILQTHDDFEEIIRVDSREEKKLLLS